MAVDNTLHGGQPHSSTLKLVCAVQPLEHAKKFVFVPHIKAYTVVFDEIDALAVFLFAADLDDRRLALARELERIGEQVGEDDLEQGWVGLANRQIADRYFDAPPLLFAAQISEHLVDKVGGGQSFLVQRLAAQAREVEQLIYQLAHGLGILVHDVQVSLGIGIELWRVFFEQDLRETVDCPQRRAQVVRDGVGEGFEFSVGGFKFFGALTNSLLKFIVERANFLLRMLCFPPRLLGIFHHVQCSCPRSL